MCSLYYMYIVSYWAVYLFSVSLNHATRRLWNDRATGQLPVFLTVNLEIFLAFCCCCFWDRSFVSLWEFPSNPADHRRRPSVSALSPLFHLFPGFTIFFTMFKRNPCWPNNVCIPENVDLFKWGVFRIKFSILLHSTVSSKMIPKSFRLRAATSLCVCR